MIRDRARSDDREECRGSRKESTERVRRLEREARLTWVRAGRDSRFWQSTRRGRGLGSFGACRGFKVLLTFIAHAIQCGSRQVPSTNRTPTRGARCRRNPRILVGQVRARRYAFLFRSPAASRADTASLLVREQRGASSDHRLHRRAWLGKVPPPAPEQVTHTWAGVVVPTGLGSSASKLLTAAGLRGRVRKRRG